MIDHLSEDNHVIGWDGQSKNKRHRTEQKERLIEDAISRSEDRGPHLKP